MPNHWAGKAQISDKPLSRRTNLDWTFVILSIHPVLRRAHRSCHPQRAPYLLQRACAQILLPSNRWAGDHNPTIARATMEDEAPSAKLTPSDGASGRFLAASSSSSKIARQERNLQMSPPPTTVSTTKMTTCPFSLCLDRHQWPSSSPAIPFLQMGPHRAFQQSSSTTPTTNGGRHCLHDDADDPLDGATSPATPTVDDKTTPITSINDDADKLESPKSSYSHALPLRPTPLLTEDRRPISDP